MEHDDDRELRRVLRTWHVPDAPDSLTPPTHLRQGPVWRSWLRRDIRVPVPVALVLSAVLLWLVATVALDREGNGVEPGTADDLRGFQPVSAVNVRIDRSADEGR